MSNLRELIPGSELWPRFVRNTSDRFEARFSLVEVTQSPSLLLQGMVGSQMPIAVSHGEGRVEVRDGAHLAALESKGLVALRYVCLLYTSLYSGLYINELLSRVLEYETRFSELFFDYLHCIQSLAGVTGTPEPALRRFELALLGHLGYGVNFTHCAGSGEPVDDTMTYRYREEKGFIASVVIDNKTFTGRQLKALNAREFPDADTLLSLIHIWSGVSIARGNLVWGDFTSDERAVNGPGPG